MAPPTSTALLGDLRQLIEAARHRAAVAVNSELVWLYWQVGARIRGEVLGDERAAYGEQTVATVSAQLVPDYGQGFSRRNLYHMMRFAEVFPEEQIVNSLRSQLTWTHLRELIAIDDPLKRNFTPRCAGSNAGAPARSRPRSAGCCSSARPCRSSRPRWSSASWRSCAGPTA